MTTLIFLQRKDLTLIFSTKERLNTRFSTKERLKGYLQTIEEGVKVFKDSIHHCNGDDGERPAHADEYDLYPQSFHMDAENMKHEFYPQSFHMDIETQSMICIPSPFI